MKIIYILLLMLIPLTSAANVNISNTSDFSVLKDGDIGFVVSNITAPDGTTTVENMATIEGNEHTITGTIHIKNTTAINNLTFKPYGGSGVAAIQMDGSTNSTIYNVTVTGMKLITFANGAINNTVKNSHAMGDGATYTVDSDITSYNNTLDNVTVTGYHQVTNELKTVHIINSNMVGNEFVFLGSNLESVVVEDSYLDSNVADLAFTQTPTRSYKGTRMNKSVYSSNGSLGGGDVTTVTAGDYGYTPYNSYNIVTGVGIEVQNATSTSLDIFYNKTLVQQNGWNTSTTVVAHRLSNNTYEYITPYHRDDAAGSVTINVTSFSPFFILMEVNPPSIVIHPSSSSGYYNPNYYKCIDDVCFVKNHTVIPTQPSIVINNATPACDGVVANNICLKTNVTTTVVPSPNPEPVTTQDKSKTLPIEFVISIVLIILGLGYFIMRK